MEKRFKCSVFLLSLVCFSFNVQAVAYTKLWTFPETLIQALKKAAQRSVRIDILYEPDVYKHNRQEVQTSALDDLFKKDNIHLSTHSDRFNQVHHKLLIIDGKKAVIGTLNFDRESFDGTAGGVGSPILFI